MRKRHLIPIPLLLAALFAAYQYFGAEKTVNPVTGRVARVGMSVNQEQALGLQSYQQVLSQSEVIPSGPDHDLVVRVTDRLIKAVGEDAPGMNWQVSLVRSDEANAFCLPGGEIVVYTGILPYTKNEAALAAVLGHEMGHAIARHGAQRMLQSSMAQAVMAGAQFSFTDMDPRQRQVVLGALGAGAQYGVLLPFSREHESEADAMGLMYMAKAGYDPHEAISFWERMEHSGGSQPPEFMSTHPSHATRIQRLNALMPKAVEAYQQSASTSRT